ncbi:MULTISPECIES: protein kinase [unclassified Nocardiopsis]|uniref:protein kinase domain-containing protein n=1 Tax=unclassified Nocardiopsis TaxID=2649073 RepID=UPI001F1C5F2D|nr:MULTISPECIES: protein kinase [unclassified Nocardiopsis]
MAMSAGFPTGEELPERIGHYVIRRRIGQGGMGVVYQAEDPRTEQFVAVKVLKPEVAGDHIARARLAREVETMRRVQSPNVAEVIDADTQAELPWVVTEYIPGPTLDATVTDHGPLRGRALTRFVTGLARAIKDIHAVDVIHRDLKPGNVIISNGEPIVIDFGIAHAVDGAKLTQTGTFVGTPSYLSPEVIEGTDLGPATDIHAWGGTVAFASTGRPPYGAGTFEVIFYRILNGEIDMDGMHEALRPLVTRAVSRDMSRRPTAAQLVEETGRLNLDLPWTEDTGNRSSGLTGSHTVYNPAVGGSPSGGGLGGAAAAGAVGAAGGYLAGRAFRGNEEWGPPHTSSGANPAASAWSLPKDPPRPTSAASSGGWASDPEATDDLSGAARQRGWDSDPEATDDLSGAANARRSWDSDPEATDDLGAGTERITPNGADDPHDPQGTMRMDPVALRDDRDDALGTRRFQPHELAAEDPQGTMMMSPVDDAGSGRRPYAEPEEPVDQQAPQTQFFNTPLHKGDFGDILTPVDDGRHSGRTQEFDEEGYGGRGGWLNRFRRGSNDRMGDYFRGDTGEQDGYDEDEEYYEDETWRMHPLVLIPVMVLLAGVALWFPWFGTLLGVVIIAGLSALDVVKAEHARRLQTRGPRSSDTMVVALSFPWAFGRMVLRTVGFGLVYLVAGILVGMVYAQFVEVGSEGANYTGAFAIFVMILLSYIMPSGREARHQAVWLVERVRFHNLYLYIGVVIGILLLTMLILSIGLSAAPSWDPFGGPSDWFNSASSG